MNKIYDFQDYKQSKEFVKELEHVTEVFELAHQALLAYAKYAPVRKVIETLQDNKIIIDIHLNNQRKIVESKGEIQ